jgi:hypothetical protein
MISNPLLIAVDPGLRACGVAVFRNGELSWAGAVRGPKEGRGPWLWRSLGAEVAAQLDRECAVGLSAIAMWHVVIETMKVYTEGKGDPDDLLELSGIGGAVAASLPAWWSVEGVLAREWNGQVPSAIRRERTRAWVEANDWLDRVDLDTTARFQQDVWSAIGIGRWKLTGSR